MKNSISKRMETGKTGNIGTGLRIGTGPADPAVAGPIIWPIGNYNFT